MKSFQSNPNKTKKLNFNINSIFKIYYKNLGRVND